ncbi:MAG: hypothetical protein HY831_04635 [Candidatus Aenigmarchaeota archaeon]|nr:hypothetical protein [Candidatus Aenigmarchaeota archaeon]
MFNILGVAFKGNISESVLKGLDIENKYFLYSNKNSVKAFIKYLEKSRYDFILGLGQYSGVDNNKLRIELECTNKFRNNTIEKKFRKIRINNFLLTENFKLSKGIGNSYCNILSFLIMDMIEKNKMKTKYSFVHIPKYFDQKKAIELISCSYS